MNFDLNSSNSGSLHLSDHGSVSEASLEISHFPTYRMVSLKRQRKKERNRQVIPFIWGTKERNRGKCKRLLKLHKKSSL